MLVVMRMLLFPFSVPVPTVLPVLVSMMLMVPLVTGVPVVLSVTVTFIVVFLTLLLVTVAVVSDSLCCTCMFCVLVLLLYSSFPANSTVTLLLPTGRSIGQGLPLLFLYCLYCCLLYHRLVV